jgi:hypothetical protein
MDSLPMAPPSCSLNELELTEQLARYRTVGGAAEIVESTRRGRVLTIGHQVPDAVIEELVTVERECCPFFELDWQPTIRRLAIGVRSSEYTSALDAISYALGFGEPLSTDPED